MKVAKSIEDLLGRSGTADSPCRDALHRSEGGDGPPAVATSVGEAVRTIRSRSLTEPIVRTTLRPILDRLGSNPTPEQILDLKVCDPAMGSGAFLVEACRYLAELLVKAWHCTTSACR